MYQLVFVSLVASALAHTPLQDNCQGPDQCGPGSDQLLVQTSTRGLSMLQTQSFTIRDVIEPEEEDDPDVTEDTELGEEDDPDVTEDTELGEEDDPDVTEDAAFTDDEAQLLMIKKAEQKRFEATIPDAAVQAIIVKAHNDFRCTMCNTPPLVWDSALAENARAYMATGAISGHCPVHDGSLPGCVGNGENMYSAAAGNDGNEWERLVNMWFAGEIDCYNFGDGTNTCTAGHFTAVAWSGTLKVGCASSADAPGRPGRPMKTQCMYSPHGNVNGPANYPNYVNKCPVATSYTYYTGSASCCSGPKTNCKKGMCGWKYATATTSKGCPADNTCSVHASCPSTSPTPPPPITSPPTPAPTISAAEAAAAAPETPLLGAEGCIVDLTAKFNGAYQCVYGNRCSYSIKVMCPQIAPGTTLTIPSGSNPPTSNRLPPTTSGGQWNGMCHPATGGCQFTQV